MGQIEEELEGSECEMNLIKLYPYMKVSNSKKKKKEKIKSNHQLANINVKVRTIETLKKFLRSKKEFLKLVQSRKQSG